MTGADALDIAREAFWTILVVSGPALILCLVVGLGIALFQALTQIQESTLTFVPKMVALGLLLLLTLPLMGAALGSFMQTIADRIVTG